MALAAVSDDPNDYRKIIKSVGEKLPEPTGWRILIALLQADEKTESGIYKPVEVLDYETVGSIVGLVLKVGDLAYKDEKKFPSGPWCEPGDYILMRSYSGTRISVRGQEFRLINDDTVEAVVSDPRGLGLVNLLWLRNLHQLSKCDF